MLPEGSISKYNIKIIIIIIIIIITSIIIIVVAVVAFVVVAATVVVVAVAVVAAAFNSIIIFFAQIAQDRQQARLEDSQDNTPSESPAPQSLEHLALKAEPAAEGAAVAGGLVGALGLASTEGGDEVLPPFSQPRMPQKSVQGYCF